MSRGITPSDRTPRSQPTSKVAQIPSDAVLTSKKKVKNTASIKSAVPVYKKGPPEIQGIKTQNKLIQKIFTKNTPILR